MSRTSALATRIPMSRNQTRFPVLSAREEFRIGNSVAFRHGLGFDICGKTFRAVHLDTTAPVTQRTCTLPTGHRGDHLRTRLCCAGPSPHARRTSHDAGRPQIPRRAHSSRGRRPPCWQRHRIYEPDSPAVACKAARGDWQFLGEDPERRYWSQEILPKGADSPRRFRVVLLWSPEWLSVAIRISRRLGWRGTGAPPTPKEEAVCNRRDG